MPTVKVNVLLVGADGMIGNCLLTNFNRKYNIISMSFYDQDKQYSFSGDLTSLSFTNKIAKFCVKPEILIFLVGLAHTKGKDKDLHEFRNVNYQTLHNLLSALKKYRKVPEKIIFASTISVYGERYNQNNYVETLGPKPFSPYAVTKLQAEHYLLDNFRIKSWILRFAPVYSSSFLLNIHRRTKIGKIFYKIGNGTKRLSLCNIENIKATVEGIIDGAVPPGIYNISDPISYSYSDLLNHIGAAHVFRIPSLGIRFLYLIGKMTNNIFLKENSVKLITDNIFPSDKISAYINLPATISDVNFGND